VEKIKTNGSLLSESDLILEKKSIDEFHEVALAEVSDEDSLLAHLIKHQEFTTTELLDVAVSFIQSEFYLAALKASDLALNSTEVVDLKLRACYMKVVCLLRRGEYRSALDTSLDALNFSVTENDILSFLYSQAEAHLRLKEYKSARSVLGKILSIDSNYRQAKERLERLNAV
jgi:tetratricopeptide (TPR) repeat protein